MGVAGAEGGWRGEPAFAESAAGPLGGHVVSMVCPWSFYGLDMRFLRTGQAGAWRSLSGEVGGRRALGSDGRKGSGPMEHKEGNGRRWSEHIV